MNKRMTVAALKSEMGINETTTTTTMDRVHALGEKIEDLTEPLFTPYAIKCTKTGTALTSQRASPRNIDVAMKRGRISVRVNALTRDIETIVVDEETTAQLIKDLNVNERDLAGLVQQAVHDRLCREINAFGARDIEKHMLMIAKQNLHHPLGERIKNVKWDGQGRLEEFSERIHVEKDYEDVLIPFLKVHLTMCIQAWVGNVSVDPKPLEPMLVLCGDEGTGKTEFVKSLLPSGMVGDSKKLTFKHDAAVIHETDSTHRVLKHPLAELGELDATIFQSADAALKNWLSGTWDDGRAAFKKTHLWPRMTTLIGTVNSPDFILNRQGARRFLPLNITNCENRAWDNENKGEPRFPDEEWMWQLYAQAYAYWKESGVYRLTENEKARQNEILDQHVLMRPWQEELASMLVEAEQKAEKDKTGPVWMSYHKIAADLMERGGVFRGLNVQSPTVAKEVKQIVTKVAVKFQQTKRVNGLRLSNVHLVHWPGKGVQGEDQRTPPENPNLEEDLNIEENVWDTE